MKLAAIVSSLLAGGLVFGSAFSSADRGTPPPVPPAPPAAPAAPAAKAPKAPKPPKAPKNKGVHVQIDGLDHIIDDQIKGALDQLARDKNIPPQVRAKITKRLESLRQKVKARVGNGSNLDPDDLGELGEEIGREMEAFGQDMEEWGEDFAKDMQKKFGGFDVRIGIGHDDDDDDDDHDDDDDDDDDHDIPSMSGGDDLDDLDDAVRDMGKLNLKPQQRAQIKQLRADSDAKVAAAKRELDRAAEQLQKQLELLNASEADIAKSIDSVTQQEAAIRKARILAWVNARRILDDGQRKKVEGAAKGRTK